MSIPYKGRCEHLKEGYCIACISKIRENWTTCMSYSKESYSDCYINLWDGDYPKLMKITKENND